MAVANRDLDASEQKHALQATTGLIVTGQTYPLFIVPYNSTFKAAQFAAIGVSGAPNYSLWIQRFIVGTGITSIAVGASVVATTYGTSGSQGFTLVGGATFPLYTGDVISLSVAAANTASIATQVTIVIQALQDVKTLLGV